MLQQEQADDYVIATGQTRTLREFVDLVFSEFGLNWPEHVVSDPALYRPTDIAEGHANPQKAFDQLGWKATATLEDVVKHIYSWPICRNLGLTC